MTLKNLYTSTSPNSEFTSQCFGLGGQELVEHSTFDSMAEAIRAERPERVFTYADDLVNIVNAKTSFVDAAGNIHYHEAIVGNKDEVKNLDAALDELHAREHDGYVVIDDETGEVYEYFRADMMEKFEEVGLGWVTEVNIENEKRDGYTISYAELEPGVYVVDFSNGTHHMIATISEDFGQSLNWLESETQAIEKLEVDITKWDKLFKGK
jgi:hypothetical protein